MRDGNWFGRYTPTTLRWFLSLAPFSNGLTPQLACSPSSKSEGLAQSQKDLPRATRGRAGSHIGASWLSLIVVWIKMRWDHGTMSLIVQFLAPVIRCGVLQIVRVPQGCRAGKFF
jgi:hypothetical protein